MFRGLDQQIATRGRGTTVLSVSAHCAIIAAVLWLAAEIRNPVVTKAETILPITLFAPAPPPPVMHVAKLQGGGGGSGAHNPAPPPPEPLPQVAKTPVILEKVSRIVDPPKLPVEPTVQINIAQKNPMPSFGMPDSPQVAMASQGSGSQNGFGVGMGGGLGAGHGVGQGPGSRAGYGGGVMNVGNGVSAPQVIHSVEPQFTPEARQANYTGTVGIQLIVDSNGDPQDVRVVRHLGMGLDEEAIAAVKQYRFRPAVYDGHPVSVQMIIDVDFRLH
jgi:TonB family protein